MGLNALTMMPGGAVAELTRTLRCPKGSLEPDGEIAEPQRGIIIHKNT